MAAENLVIKPATEEPDLRIIAGLAEIIWHECYVGCIPRGQIRYMLDNFQSVAALQDQIANQNYEYFLFLQAGRPVGYAGIVAENGRLLLSKIYTLRGVHGSGLADGLFQFVEEAARARGCGLVWLTVNRHNARAIAAYKKHGYAIAREQVSDIGGGFVMDDYVMEKKIKNRKGNKTT